MTKKLKPPLTFKEQITKFKEDHKLEIEDEAKALEILKKTNYYRLSGYGLGLTEYDNKEHYKDSISFDYLFNLYCFDSQFKSILMSGIEQLEIELRTQIAYRLSTEYEADALYHEENFLYKENKNGKPIYSIVMESFENEINRSTTNLVIEHHKEKYGSKFPIWVAVELMSFGILALLFGILQDDDQTYVARHFNTDPEHLQNWIWCLVEVRNICAHHARLYNTPLDTRPNLENEYRRYIKKPYKIFPVLIIIRKMFNANEQWQSLLIDLTNILKKYEEVVNLDFMRFPKNWEEVLGDGEQSK